MSDAAVTRDGLEGVRPGYQAPTGEKGGRRRRKGRGDPHAMVPPATFSSYYGRPIVKASPWTNDIPAYLFLGGMAGGSSVVGAACDLTGRPLLARALRTSALGGIGASFYFLVHDLGRPARFLHMMRIAKPTSPMSVGTWILAVYGPFAGLAALAEVPAIWPTFVRPLAPLAGRLAGLVAAATGPGVATYTAVLIADTATPAWKEGGRELPFVFGAGALASAAGVGLISGPAGEVGPVRRLAVGAGLAELAATRWMEARMGMAAEAMHEGPAKPISRAAELLLAAGVVLSVAGRRSRTISALAGLSLLSGAACTRFAIFEAGQHSARDPRFTVIPQRERMQRREAAGS